MNICFYTSDYGYGHAARDIALIRRITDEFNANVYVKTEYPFDFMKKSLKGVKVIKRCNDVGVVFNGESVTADKPKTEEALKEWISSWSDYIEEEKRFCEENKIDIIFSDIVPQPFIIADELGIPSIAFSNFTWYYIYSNLLGENEVTEGIKEAYRCVDYSLVLPFNDKNDVFRNRKEISLVSREVTVDRNKFRRKHGLAEGDFLIYVGSGQSFSISLKDFKVNKNVKFLVSSNLRSKNKLRIPSGETESQNYIAMCDLIVSKTGYSTVSEAIRAKIPMFLFTREGYKEDSIIASEVQKLGIGKEISYNAFLNGEWLEEMDDLEKYREQFDAIDKRFKEDGASEVLDLIREFS